MIDIRLKAGSEHFFELHKSTSFMGECTNLLNFWRKDFITFGQLGDIAHIYNNRCRRCFKRTGKE